ncbi:hypothetical protein BJ165DRAFT_1404319 [Panaeolus papilionaceus]|nr:hypothetical protein BJ165DRAFT_1404319 [Panaeolus papilionaceus]
MVKFRLSYNLLKTYFEAANSQYPVTIILFSFLEIISSAISAANIINDDEWLYVLLSKIALGYSIVTSLWIGVLLFYINRPLQSHFYTKKAVHLASFIVFALTWPVLGFMFLAFLYHEYPSPSDASRDAVVGCMGMAGVFISISSLIAAIRVGRVKVGADGNIAGPSVNHDA